MQVKEVQCNLTSYPYCKSCKTYQSFTKFKPEPFQRKTMAAPNRTKFCPHCGKEISLYRASCSECKKKVKGRGNASVREPGIFSCRCGVLCSHARSLADHTHFCTGKHPLIDGVVRESTTTTAQTSSECAKPTSDQQPVGYVVITVRKVDNNYREEICRGAVQRSFTTRIRVRM